MDRNEKPYLISFQGKMMPGCPGNFYFPEHKPAGDDKDIRHVRMALAIKVILIVNIHRRCQSKNIKTFLESGRPQTSTDGSYRISDGGPDQRMDWFTEISDLVVHCRLQVQRCTSISSSFEGRCTTPDGFNAQWKRCYLLCATYGPKSSET